MGTHPIFESDFDCLTEGDRYVEMKRKSTTEKEPEEPSSVCVVAPIEYYGPIGRGIRHCLLAFIEVGQPLLVALQKRRTANFTRAMRTASLLGFEEFFTFFVIFLNLCINTRLARLYIILMAFAFYCVGCAKAALCLPRPRLPLIKPLEAAHDWALPSNHAVMASCLPLYVWFYSYLHAATLGLTQWHCVFICILMCFWSSSVMFSRLYLGVHSPADIVAGGLLGCLLLSAFLQIDDAIDFFISIQGVYPIICYLALVLCLCALFPSTDASNPCFPESVSVFGVVLGTVAGRCLRATSAGHVALLEEYDSVSYEYIIRSIIRMAVGAVTVLFVKAVVKGILKAIVPKFYEFIRLDSYSRSKHLKETKKDPVYRYAKHLHPSFTIPPVNLPTSGSDSPDDILNRMADPKFGSSPLWDWDLPVSFLTYGVSMFLVVESMPAAFAQLNL